MTIQQKFAELKKQGRKAFIAYVPFGFPSIQQTKDIIFALQDSGVDIIELGIPFSDPIADGPIIQAAATHALKHHATTEKFFSLLKECRSKIRVPIAIMTYYNPVLQYGIKKFLDSMNDAGASALLVVDLPVEESTDYIKSARMAGVETIYFATPVTSVARLRKIITASRGFIYYVSVTGITGPKDIAYSKLASKVSAIKKLTETPVCVGFGVHTGSQVRELHSFCDGAIVGSDIVRFISETSHRGDFLIRLKKHVQTFSTVQGKES